jgi:hypothetical protein
LIGTTKGREGNLANGIRGRKEGRNARRSNGRNVIEEENEIHPCIRQHSNGLWVTFLFVLIQVGNQQTGMSPKEQTEMDFVKGSIHLRFVAQHNVTLKDNSELRNLTT